MRKPLGPTAMDRTVRFRLTEEDLDMLRYLAEGDNGFSTVIRNLITAEYKREKRRRRRIS